MKIFQLAVVFSASLPPVAAQCLANSESECDAIELLQSGTRRVVEALSESKQQRISFNALESPMQPPANFSFEGDCCGDTGSAARLFQHLGAVPMAVLHGTPDGICCKQQLGLAPSAPQPIFSSSKWITGLVFLRLVEEGMLASLDVKVSEILPWWSDNGNGKNVTVRNLLLQTDGMKTYEGGLGACTAGTTVDCAKQAYETAWPEEGQGAPWTYSETSFYVAGAVAMELTGAQTYNDVFLQLILPKVPTLDPMKCFWGFPSVVKADPGGGMICSAEEFATIMLALAKGQVISAESEQEMKSSNTKALPDDTLGGISVPGLTFKYGLGHWQEMNAISGALELMSSIGYAGCYPWMTPDKSRWGVVVRMDPLNEASDAMKIAAVLMHFGHGLEADAIAAMR